ncbi:MAG: hypothetical protein V1722_01125 [Candidatus Micrarchaeota archaeon]
MAFERLKKMREGIARRLEARHEITLLSEHELEHDGMKLRVAKTNCGHLILFPAAKKVSPSDILAMMNEANKKTISFPKERCMLGERSWRAMEFPGHYMLPNRWKIFDPGRFYRVGRQQVIKSSQRRGPLHVFHRVEKLQFADEKDSTHMSVLEEALTLHVARKVGVRCEAPVAVFLGKSRFPEIMFTTVVTGRHSQIETNVSREHGIPGLLENHGIILEDAMMKGQRPVWIDAERSHSPEAKKLERELREKIRKLK